MSWRWESYTTRKGEKRQHILVDVTFEHADGRVERVRKVSPVQTVRGAQRYEQDLRKALLDGTWGKEATKSEIPTLARFADDFVKTYAKANNKPSEVHSKERHLRKHILPALGAKRLDEITTRDIEAYKARMRQTHAAKSINNHLAILSKLFEVAIEWGKIETAPRIRLMKTTAAGFRWLTEDELARLVAAAEDAWRVMVLAGGRTGLRLGELRALRWVDVELAEARLFVRRAAWLEHVGAPKGGRERELPLTREVVEALRRHPRRIGSELVFPADDGGLRDTNDCQRAIHAAVAAAGLGKFGWHVLRHTFASHLVQRGVPLYEVKELLGHVDIKTTERYAHLAPGFGRKAVAVLERATGR